MPLSGRMDTPLISVALVVRNGENTIALAVRSVLAQTYEIWELLIADDGSRDRTVARIQGFKDGRIRLLPHPESRGLAFRLNELIDMSLGKYLARMDADDFAFGDRFARQVRFLEEHAEVDLLGCGTINFEGDGRIAGKSRVVARHEEICARPWRGFPLYHPTWMGKTEWFRKNRYAVHLRRAQDFDLLLRAYRTSRFSCLEEPLLGYRVERLTMGRQSRSRRNVCLALLHHGLLQHDVRCVWGVGEQALKFLLDSFAIVTGLRYRLLRHRALAITESERAAFNAAWATLHQS